MEDDELLAAPVQENTDSEEAAAEEKRSRADDAAAMQAAVCLVLGLMLLVTDIFLPETAAALLEKLRQFSAEVTFVLPDPVEWVISHWHG